MFFWGLRFGKLLRRPFHYGHMLASEGNKRSRDNYLFHSIRCSKQDLKAVFVINSMRTRDKLICGHLFRDNFLGSDDSDDKKARKWRTKTTPKEGSKLQRRDDDAANKRSASRSVKKKTTKARKKEEQTTKGSKVNAFPTWLIKTHAIVSAFWYSIRIKRHGNALKV